MQWVILILVIILALCFFRIIVDRKHLKNITEQLEISLYKNEHFEIKFSDSSKLHKELINQINQLNSVWREAEANYYRTSQQSKEMISSITHDFRTPLTSMLGYIQILQEIPDEETQLKYLKIIEGRTHALTRLVNDFYEMSILDSNEYPLTIEKVNPVVVLQNQLSLYYDDLVATYKNINIDINEEVILANCDVNALNRIISNLIKNALNHGSDTFTIKTTFNNNQVTLSFENMIKEDETIDINKIFDRTFRNDKTRNINSTGLGLSIAKELASLNNCKLEARQSKNTIIFDLIIPLIK